MKWEDLIKTLLIKTPNKEDKFNIYYHNILEEIENVDNPFEVCFYRNIKGKLKTLENQYINQSSLDENLEKLKTDRMVGISLIGKPKHGSNSNYQHCINSMIIDSKLNTITIGFRSSDLFKKLPIDLYFIANLIKSLNLNNYKIIYNFDSITLRAPFLYIYLNYLYINYGEERLLKFLNEDHLITKKFIDYYNKNLNKKLNYKSLERAMRYMKQSKVWPYIKDLFYEIL